MDDEFVIVRVPKKSFWIKYRVVAEFAGFPDEIAELITDYLQVLKLLDWINPDNIESGPMTKNPDAFLSGTITNLGKANHEYLVENPSAIDYIKTHPDKFLKFIDKWTNPKIVEWLFPLGIYPESDEYLSRAPCQMAIDKVIEMNNGDLMKAVDKLSWNSAAIDLIRNHRHAIDHDIIWANSAAIDILTDLIASGENPNWEWLSANESRWVINLLQANQGRNLWRRFSYNKMIFEPRPSPDKKELKNILTGKFE